MEQPVRAPAETGARDDGPSDVASRRAAAERPSDGQAPAAAEGAGERPAGDGTAAPQEGRLACAEVAALFLAHEAELRRFLQGLLRDGQLASDALQNTFAKMIERGHEIRGASRKAWLFRVAFHEAMALRRRNAVGDRVLRQSVWGRRGDEAPSDELVIRWEEVARVRAALEELPPEQSQVVRMRIYEEKTFAVIAEELAIPLGTALGRMRAALEKLRLRLADS